MNKVISIILAGIILFSAPCAFAASDSSVEYKDEKNDLVFILPGGWREIDSDDIGIKADYCFINENAENEQEEKKAKEAAEKKSSKKKKEKKKEYTPYISYSSEDMYSKLSSNEKDGKQREDFDLNSVPLKVIAEYVGIKEKKFSKATYNRVDYYRFTTKCKKISKKLDKEQRAVGYITVVDGWIYQFMFFDGTTSPDYDDFKSLMGSVIIKDTVPEIKPKKKSAASKAAGIIIVVLSIGAFAFVLIKTKKK